MKTDNYDFVIIGAGTAGGTLSRHLARSSKKSLLLEQGSRLPMEKRNWDVEEVAINDR